MTAALRLAGVVKRFGATRALDGASLEVRPGEVHALLGENGAGKSTLLSALGGLVRPDAGSLEVNGQPYAPRSPRDARAAGIALIHQELSLFPHLSVAENVLMGAYIIRRDRALVKRRHAEVEELFPVVRERADDRAGNLSGGQRRMVEFARALMLDPKLVLLDEPAGGINPVLIERMGEMIRELNSYGKTFLIVEHNMPFVLGLCDPIHVLARGRTMASGTPDEIQRDPAVIDAYLGDDFQLETPTDTTKAVS